MLRIGSNGRAQCSGGAFFEVIMKDPGEIVLCGAAGALIEGADLQVR